MFSRSSWSNARWYESTSSIRYLSFAAIMLLLSSGVIRFGRSARWCIIILGKGTRGDTSIVEVLCLCGETDGECMEVAMDCKVSKLLRIQRSSWGHIDT